ncbi:hypothetical protein K469DRAFT_158658 [Zopfia rhizophila CBS 207.26]|uniref:Uncharacterized protein n=1 Tax=Zopfia rhizophila CBS 207.26 TaxID=1314779 RepID=A0A6A6E4K5_9PEZI|nr:hypothetical protein K469DRAFT_158658 [Zopfia rhizophila CBS 207.26]
MAVFTSYQPLRTAVPATVDLTGPNQRDSNPQRQAAIDADGSTIANDGSRESTIKRTGDAGGSSSPGDSQDMPIVLDDDEPDAKEPNAELNAAASDDDDERTLVATPPANRNSSRSSPPAVPAKSFTNDHAIHPAAGSAANGVSNNHNHGSQGVSRDPDYTTSRKRSGSPVGPRAPLKNGPLPKRCHRSRVATQKGREETSARLRSRKGETLYYTLPLPRCGRE